jgi:hypothetical protein
VMRFSVLVSYLLPPQAVTWNGKLTNRAAITPYKVGVGYTLSPKMRYAALILALDPSDWTSLRCIVNISGGCECATIYSNPPLKAFSSLNVSFTLSSAIEGKVLRNSHFLFSMSIGWILNPPLST